MGEDKIQESKKPKIQNGEKIPAGGGRIARGDGRIARGDGRIAMGDGRIAMGDGRIAMRPYKAGTYKEEEMKSDERT